MRLCDDAHEHGNGRLIERQFFDNATQFNSGMGMVRCEKRNDGFRIPDFDYAGEGVVPAPSPGSAMPCRPAELCFRKYVSDCLPDHLEWIRIVSRSVKT